MSKSGGSPYDILTPREWEVLQLIRDGHSDEDIAERLSIKLGAVHYHEANIFAKFGVSTREEAAVWEPKAEPPRPVFSPPAPSPEANDEPTTVVTALDPSERPPSIRSGMLLLASALVVIALIIGGGAVIGLDLGGGNTGDSDAVAAGNPTRTQRPSTTPRPTIPRAPTATPRPTPFFPALEPAPLVEFPQDLALIIFNSCNGCENGSLVIGRVYQAADGSIIQDVLFDPLYLGITRSFTWEGVVMEEEPYMIGTAVSQDGSDIAIALCIHEYCGGLGSPDQEAQVVLYRSRDGGVTWQESDFPADTYIMGFDGAGELLVTRFNPDEKTNDFFYWPDGAPIKPPEAATRDGWPLLIEGGGLAWIAGDGQRIYATTGELLLDLSTFGFDGAYPNALIADDEGVLLSWYGYSNYWGGSGTTYLSRIGASGKLGITVAAPGLGAIGGYDTETGNIFASLIQENPSDPAAWAIVNLDDGIIHPITWPFSDGESVFEGGYNGIEAVQYGPFALVTGTGSCLNVRESFGVDAAVLECVADGVLLHHHDTLLPAVDGEGNPAPSLGGSDWLKVTTPSGKEGWVSTDYVEY